MADKKKSSDGKKKDKKGKIELDESEEEDLGPSQGIFEIEVIGARRLAARHKKTESSFPYCKVIWGEEEFLTETIEEELNPRWKKNFQINLIGKNLDVEEIKFEIWCAKTKTLLGELSVPVAGHRDTPLKFAKEHWYPLSGGKATPKRQEIAIDQSTKKKLDQKSDKALKFTGDLCLKLGLVVEEEKAKKQVFSVTASKAIQIEDYQGVDIQDMKVESEILAQESNDAAKRALRVAEQTRQIGAETLAKLDSQGQKLLNAQSDLDQIDSDLKEANRELRGIHSLGGQLKNGLTSSNYSHVDRSKLTKEQRADLARQEKEDREKGKKKKQEKKKTIEEILAEKKAEEDELRKKDTFQHLIESGQFDHISSDAQFKIRETEQTIDAIALTVGDLKSMAEDMSHTLDQQNVLIDELQVSAINANARLKKTRAKVKREF